MSNETTTADSQEQQGNSGVEQPIGDQFELDVTGTDAIPSTLEVLTQTIETIKENHPFAFGHELRIQDGKPALEVASHDEHSPSVTIFEEGDHHVVIYKYSDEDEIRMTTEPNVQEACIRTMEIFNVYE